jgi:C1A family cysteine protease
MPPVGYQGSEGSCVSFAVAYAARSCEEYYRSGASSYSTSTNIFSPEYTFNQTQAGSCAASALLDALDLIVNKGVCTWSSMPYNYTNGCSLQPTATQNSEASKYKITSYSQIYTSDITAMKTTLSNKHPLMMTFANDNNFNNAGPGYIWKSYDYSGGFGGHAITICGYDDAKHAYKAINSWGTTWGDAGYIWIDYDFLPTVKSTVYFMN